MLIDPIPAIPAIEAERFDLRPLRRSDQGLVEMYASDPRVARQTQNTPHPLPPGATEAFIRRHLSEERDEDVWVIDGTKQGLAEVLGLIALKMMDRNQSELSYWIGPAFWNSGLATEAVRAILEANPQDASHIYAQVFQDNPGSARVLTNCGFDYLGDAEAFSVARNAMVPTWTYALKLVS